MRLLLFSFFLHFNPMSCTSLWPAEYALASGEIVNTTIYHMDSECSRAWCLHIQFTETSDIKALKF